MSEMTPEILRQEAEGPSPWSAWSDTAIVAASRRLLLACASAWEADIAKREALEIENEQWKAQYLDDTAPQIRPMTRMEHRMMDLEGECGAKEARIEALEKRLREAAEAAWKSDVVDCDMLDLTIGRDGDYSSKQEWLEDWFGEDLAALAAGEK